MRALRFVQWAVLVLGVMGAGKAHAIIHLELEGGGGLTLRGPQSPMVTGRAALNVLSILDIGLRGQAVFGGEDDLPCPSSSPNCGIKHKAWSVFPELRLRTPTPVIQFDLALGGGLGYLQGIRLDNGVDGNDSAKPFGQAGLGLRINIPTTDVYIRAEGSVSLYTSVVGPDIGDGITGGLLPVYQVQLMIGYAGIGF